MSSECRVDGSQVFPGHLRVVKMCLGEALAGISILTVEHGTLRAESELFIQRIAIRSSFDLGNVLGQGQNERRGVGIGRVLRLELGRDLYRLPDDKNGGD